jgi:hypothetical protein
MGYAFVNFVHTCTSVPSWRSSTAEGGVGSTVARSVSWPMQESRGLTPSLVTLKTRGLRRVDGRQGTRPTRDDFQDTTSVPRLDLFLLHLRGSLFYTVRIWC